MDPKVVVLRRPDARPPVVVQLRVHVNVEVVLVRQLFLQRDQAAQGACFCAAVPTFFVEFNS